MDIYHNCDYKLYGSYMHNNLTCQALQAFVLQIFYYT